MLSADSLGRPVCRVPSGREFPLSNLPGDHGRATDVDRWLAWLRTRPDRDTPDIARDIDALLDDRLVLMAEEIAA